MWARWKYLLLGCDHRLRFFALLWIRKLLIWTRRSAQAIRRFGFGVVIVASRQIRGVEFVWARRMGGAHRHFLARLSIRRTAPNLHVSLPRLAVPTSHSTPAFRLVC